MSEITKAIASDPGLLLLVLAAAFWLALRLVRAAVILARGWPPPHLDADGDEVRD